MPARLRPRTETPYQKAQDLGAAGAIRTAWSAHGGAGARVADALGISKSTLYREIERLGIAADLPGYRPRSAYVA